MFYRHWWETWSLVLQRFLLHWFFPFHGTDFNAISLISLPVDISEVRGNSVPGQKKHTHTQNGVSTSPVYEIRLQTYVQLLLWIMGSVGGGDPVHISRCYGSVLSYRSCSRARGHFVYSYSSQIEMAVAMMWRLGGPVFLEINIDLNGAKGGYSRCKMASEDSSWRTATFRQSVVAKMWVHCINHYRSICAVFVIICLCFQNKLLEC
jgi:hypothetical protein